MKKVCFVGACGHSGSAMAPIANHPELFSVPAVSPGAPGVVLTGLVKRLIDKGLPSPKVYDDYREMLDKEQPDILVVDAYFCDHAEMSIEGLKRGIHVYCEKPAATTLEDLDRLEAVYREAKEKGVHFAYMLTTRYDPWFYTAYQAVQQGAIGEIRMLNGQKSYKAGKRGPLFHKRETYGGTIPWVGIHALDWVLWFSGKRVKAVSAVQSSMANNHNGTMEATAICLFQLEDEVVAHINIDYLRPQTAETHGDDRIRIAGTKGVIEVRGGKVYLINGEAEGQRELPLLQPPQIFEDFAASLEGKPSLITAEQSLYFTRVCLTAQKAADTGEIIRMD